MRLSATRVTAAAQGRGLGNQLWDLAGSRPSLDLPFADFKSLADAVTGANLVDHTRASSGTYVGSDGLIKTATTNLLLRSEEFDNAAWTSGAATTVTPNYGTAPNDTTTADRVVMTAGAGTFITQSVGITSGITYTFSVYAKATSGTSSIALQQGGSNIQSWTIGESWQRLSVNFTAATTGSTTFGFDNADSATDLLLWGAQLEQSDTVGEYVKTTSTINSAPRFNHDPTTGESLGLLVEESRTNLLLWSEEFDQSQWTVSTAGGTVTITPNAALAPDGQNVADRFESSGGSNGIQQVLTLGLLTHTYSLYVKQAGADSSAFIRLSVGPFYFSFDLVNGTFFDVDASFSPPVATQVGNGWWRISGTRTTTSTANAIRVFCAIGASSDVYLWGAQLEEGSEPTSYIPTAGTTVIRAADLPSISGANFSSWYRQDEGTVFVEITPIGPTPASNQAFIAIESAANNSIRLLHQTTTGRAVYQVQAPSGLQVNGPLGAGALAQNVPIKVGLAIKENDFYAVRTGGFDATDTTAVVPTGLTNLELGFTAVFPTTRTSFLISRLTYWPTRLSDATLQAITQ